MPYVLFRYTSLVLRHRIIFIYTGFMVGYEWILFISHITGRKTVFRPSALYGDDMDTLMKRYGILKPLVKILFRKLTFYFSINTAFSKKYRNVLPPAINLFESLQGVNYKEFHPVSAEKKQNLRKRLKLPEDIPLIISVGYVIKRKGYHALFEQLAKVTTPFLYLVIGDYFESSGHKVPENEKTEMEELYLQGKKLLSSKIDFPGPKNNVAEYLQAGDIFLHGSTVEGTPNAVLEAMVCKIVTVMKKLEGISDEFIKNKIHVLDYDNYDELPEIIRSCLGDISKYRNMTENAHHFILNNFTFEKVTSRLFKQLDQR